MINQFVFNRDKMQGSKVDSNLMSKNYENPTWKQAFRQIIASSIAQLIVTQVGMNLSFSAILLPQIRNEQLFLTQNQESWLASLLTLSLPIGAFCTGSFMDSIGRKRMCMLTLIPFGISWLINAFAKTIWHLYLARIIAGFSSGLTVCSLVYTSEITHANFRPMLLSLNSVFVSLGVLFTCFFGLWFNWRIISLIFSLMSFLVFILLIFVPESPQWLFTFKEKPARAYKALKWFYPSEKLYENQCELLQTTRKTNLNEQMNFRSPTVYKPLGILLTIFCFQQLSGCYIFFFYATDLFRKLGSNNEFIEFFLLGILRFVMALIAAIISKRFGRRPLFIYSGIGMGVASVYTAIYLTLTSRTSNDLIPIISMLIYVCLSSIAFLVIPWTLASEILPVNVRGRLGGWVVAFAYTLMFIIVKGFPFLIDFIEIQWIFYIVSFVNFCSVIFIYYFLPETFGKSHHEIEDYFK